MIGTEPRPLVEQLLAQHPLRVGTLADGAFREFGHEMLDHVLEGFGRQRQSPGA